jgi:hypothetical protein
MVWWWTTVIYQRSEDKDYEYPEEDLPDFPNDDEDCMIYIYSHINNWSQLPGSPVGVGVAQPERNAYSVVLKWSILHEGEKRISLKIWKGVIVMYV